MGEHKHFNLSLLKVADVLAELGTSQRGLSAREAAERQELHGPNTTDLPVRDVRVTRGGHELTVATDELVVGDIVRLHAGMQAPADLRLIETNHLIIGRTTMFGHMSNDASIASPNLALTGRRVTEGQGVGVVIATGNATSRVQRQRSRRATRRGHLQQLHPTIRLGFITALVLAASTMVYPTFISRMPAEYILACGGIVLLAGSPWLLPLIVRLVTLPRRREARLDPVLTPGAWVAPDGSTQPSILARTASTAVELDRTQTAMLRTWRREQLEETYFGADEPELGAIPYAPSRELASSIRAYGNSGKPTLFVGGEPSPLLARCTHIMIGDHRRALSTRDREKIMTAQGDLPAAGFAYRTLTTEESRRAGDIDELETGLTWLGLLTYHIETPLEEKRRRTDAAERAIGIALTHHFALAVTTIIGLALVAHFHGLWLIAWPQVVALLLLPLALLALPGDPYEPRPLHAPARYARLRDMVWGGLLAGGLSLLNYYWFISRHHMDASAIPLNTPIHQQLMTASFVLLVLIFILQTLIARSDHGLATRLQRANRPLWISLGLIALFALLAPQLVSGFQPLGTVDVLITLLLAGAYAVIEQFRVYDRRNHPDHIHALHHAARSKRKIV